jgi:hypothetical protein
MFNEAFASTSATQNMADKPVIYFLCIAGLTVSGEGFRISTSTILVRGSNGRKAAVCARSLGAPWPVAPSLNAGSIRCGTAPGCGRSDRAASAVRGRSLNSSPGPVGLCRAATRRALDLCSLTPARWQSKTWRRQFEGPNGAGDAVPDGTAVELWRNHQPIDLTAEFLRFQRFQFSGLAHVRVGMRVQVRAYMYARSTGTMEPLFVILTNHKDSGSEEVPARFHLEPAGAACGESGGILPFRNKLASGYWPVPSIELDQVARSTVMRGRAAQTFGRRALGRADRGGAGLAGRLDLVDEARGSTDLGNGGFQPISRCVLGPVGTTMLEGWAQGRGFAWLAARCPMPVRLTRAHLGEAPQGGARPSAPPLAPFAAASLPSMVAREACGISTGLRRDPRLGRYAQLLQRRQILGCTIGSGWKSARRAPDKRMPGRGEIGGGGGLGPRRQGHARTGGACVN